MKWWRVAVAAWAAGVPVLGACSVDSSGTDGAAPATTTPSPSWVSCQTRLDFDRAVIGVADPDPAVRRAALSTAEAIPPPAGLEQAWITLVEIMRRYVDLAARVTETDPGAFRQAVDQLAQQDTAMASLNGLTNEGEQRQIGQLRVEGPCDATGMPADFGCAAPQACTQQWIDAVESGDTTALSLLGSVWLEPFGTTVVDVEVGSCDEAQDRPGVQRCTFAGEGTKGSVDWLTTTDGRWYGVDAEVSTFAPVDSTVPGP